MAEENSLRSLQICLWMEFWYTDMLEHAASKYTDTCSMVTVHEASLMPHHTQCMHCALNAQHRGLHSVFSAKAALVHSVHQCRTVHGPWPNTQCTVHVGTPALSVQCRIFGGVNGFTRCEERNSQQISYGERSRGVSPARGDHDSRLLVKRR